jgi:hypothetical protein
MMHDIKPIDHEEIRAKIASIDTYWENQPTDQPHTLNGFAGTWAFSDHNLIPDGLRNFIMESFPKVEKFKRIPLDQINTLMNDVWEGPGSMPKIARLTKEMRIARTNSSVESSSSSVHDVKTIDDYSDEEMVSFRNDSD